MCEGISIGGNVGIQISGGGASVEDIQSGLATAAALAALATSVAGREQQASVNAPNHIAVTVDMSSATWNTVATHEVFTITGAVRMRLWIIASGAFTGGEGGPRISVGYFGNTTAIIGTNDTGNINDGDFLRTPAGNGSYSLTPACLLDFCTRGTDIGYEITVAAESSGTLIFHCVWEPLSIGATVVAGAGGPL